MKQVLFYTFFGWLMLTALVTTPARATPAVIDDFSVFFNSPDINGGMSLQDNRIAFGGFLGPNQLDPYGLTVQYTDNLVDNLGTLTWQVYNDTGMALDDVWFFGFLDADMSAFFPFSDYGDAESFTPGAGASDALPDAWEIDDIGFGDIGGNLFAGALDNDVFSPFSFFDFGDVGLALGFDIGQLPAGAKLHATFTLSQASNGLHQYDAFNPDEGFYLDGAAHLVPEPTSLALLGTVIASFGLAMKRRWKDVPRLPRST